MKRVYQANAPIGDVTKIPKWAQKYISDLEGELKRTGNRVAEQEAYIAGRHEGSNVYLSRGAREDDRPLPPNAHVNFRFGNLDWDSAIEVYHDHNRPESLYVASLTGWLSIMPSSGNSIRLRTDRW